jgi:hypothetical protein
MTAVPFLQSAIFGPEEIKAMHIAFVNVCTALDVCSHVQAETATGVASAVPGAWRGLPA